LAIGQVERLKALIFLPRFFEPGVVMQRLVGCVSLIQSMSRWEMQGQQ
jgi:hypothetical protein